MIITAKRESFAGFNYTSSRIISKDKVSVTYGRVDVRALLPKGQGIWPAIWMLGESIDEIGWPRCGEIDIMEMIGGGGREKTLHGTVHYDDNGYKSINGNTTLTEDLGDKFRVYSIIWNENSISWYLDDVKFHEVDISSEARSEFHEDHFFIFNVAVGGNWPGSPNAETIFPQSMMVDYIRVFQ